MVDASLQVPDPVRPATATATGGDPHSYAPEPALDAAAAERAIGITAVERDTGISKETLRVWERRYGFPAPRRDASGERLFPPDQVQRLRLIKRLLDAGHRPGRIVAAPEQVLLALVRPSDADTPDAAATTDKAPGLVGTPQAAPPSEEQILCLKLLRSHDVDGLRRAMSQALLRRGLADAVSGVFAPLTTAVGELWMRGEMQIFEEHIFSESMQLVLRQAIQSLPPAQRPGGPRVLLTTLPGEAHALGLLMAEALFSLEGAACLSLGVQTPTTQLPAAAAAHRADIIALSFSGFIAVRAVHEGLAALRAALPADTQIWAGGSSRALRHASCPSGVLCLDGLADIATALARWRASAGAAERAS